MDSNRITNRSTAFCIRYASTIPKHYPNDYPWLISHPRLDQIPRKHNSAPSDHPRNPSMDGVVQFPANHSAVTCVSCAAAGVVDG